MDYSRPWLCTAIHARTLSPVPWWTEQSMSGRADSINGEDHPRTMIPIPIERIRSRHRPWSGREFHCTMNHPAESYREETGDRVCHQWRYSSWIGPPSMEPIRPRVECISCTSSIRRAVIIHELHQPVLVQVHHLHCFKYTTLILLLAKPTSQSIRLTDRLRTRH